MTETSEDGNYLVRVRAQVMSRDDSSGGWVPLGGGGLSNVSVRKRPRISSASAGSGPETSSSSKQKHDYLIYGKRISDECTVLRCTIKKDFEYNKVMPTFHHWKTEDKKFGLTFQTAADARAFDKGVRTAVEELLDGFADNYPQSALQKQQTDVGDDDVFMTLNLPQEPMNSRSSSDSSSKGSDHLHKMHYLNDRPGQLSYDSLKGDKENYSYVQLSVRPMPDYNYPIVEDEKPQPCQRDTSPTIKKSLDIEMVGQPPLPYKGSATGSSGAKSDKPPRIKIRCRHCHELYTEDQNRRGACEYAPDRIKEGINWVTCNSCAQAVSYHCASDAEGDFAQQLCDCSDENCGKRWFCLTLLSVILPCLWFYPPLKLCHWCGVRCGVCGGKHNMMPN